jgi:hypothetical protein
VSSNRLSGKDGKDDYILHNPMAKIKDFFSAGRKLSSNLMLLAFILRTHIHEGKDSIAKLGGYTSPYPSISVQDNIILLVIHSINHH